MNTTPKPSIIARKNLLNQNESLEELFNEMNKALQPLDFLERASTVGVEDFYNDEKLSECFDSSLLSSLECVDKD